MKAFATIKSYISAQPKAARPLLNEVYDVIKANAPGAEEAIKYGMPTFVGKRTWFILHSPRAISVFIQLPLPSLTLKKSCQNTKLQKGQFGFLFRVRFP